MTDWAKGLEKLLGVISAAVLFLMMIITTVDVFGRYVLNQPLPGGFEMTEMALAVLIYAALPLVSMRREHIVIDTLDSLMSPAVKAFFNKLSDFICCLTLSGIGYLIFRRAVRRGRIWRHHQCPQITLGASGVHHGHHDCHCRLDALGVDFYPPPRARLAGADHHLNLFSHTQP